MITGEAKKQYQREYMQKRRLAQKTALQDAPQSMNSVRPDVRPAQKQVLDPEIVRPKLDPVKTFNNPDHVENCQCLYCRSMRENA